MHRTDDKRISQRIQVEVPVYIGHEKTVTRDISWAGLYFLTDQSLLVGGDFTFFLDLNYALPGRPIKLDCRGEVIRIEQCGKKFGVAAKINDFQYLN